MSTDCSQTGSALFQAPGVGKAPLEVAARRAPDSRAGNASTGTVWLVWDWTLGVCRIGALQSADLRLPQLSAINPVRRPSRTVDMY